MNPSGACLADRPVKPSVMVPPVVTDPVKCSPLYAPNVARILRYPLNPAKAGRFIAVTASQK